jgi:hypothetical protein
LGTTLLDLGIENFSLKRQLSGEIFPMT